jgi:hypothetical protein
MQVRNWHPYFSKSLQGDEAKRTGVPMVDSSMSKNGWGNSYLSQHERGSPWCMKIWYNYSSSQHKGRTKLVPRA